MVENVVGVNTVLILGWYRLPSANNPHAVVALQLEPDTPFIYTSIPLAFTQKHPIWTNKEKIYLPSTKKRVFVLYDEEIRPMDFVLTLKEQTFPEWIVVRRKVSPDLQIEEVLKGFFNKKEVK